MARVVLTALPKPATWKKHPVYDLFVSKIGKIASPYPGNRFLMRKAQPDKDGYLRLQIKGSSRRFRRFVHHLVLETWKGPKPTKNHVTRHLNGKRTKNWVSNLKWGTPKENSADRDAHGKTQRGTNHYRAKLTSAIVRRIKATPYSYGLFETLAKKYGVSATMVGLVYRGKYWKHV